MDQYIDKIGLFIEANQIWAGPITFLLTLGESMVLLGLFIPATALMLLTGGLIGAGTLDPWGVIIWGIAGAIVGDALSYWLGRWAGPGVLRRWPLKQQRTGVARARLFFYRYGFASVLIGRPPRSSAGIRPTITTATRPPLPASTLKPALLRRSKCSARTWKSTTCLTWPSD